MVTSQQLQPVASSSRTRDDGSPLPFPATQVFQQRESWPIQVTREDPNIKNEGQDSVARLFQRIDRNSRKNGIQGELTSIAKANLGDMHGFQSSSRLQRVQNIFLKAYWWVL
ncbi:hypothetical protein O181_010027 [Austropuccinia psidii MF-1]|uniref:Uncharacterized protein n=1 Tax=Austropuccinia psidii MF-1 TaxID=1389203 RepID=A0A9Q3BSX7_9BASI|nr:hypothetical protein [Austropuccinia psidii MF-1]